MKKAFSFICVGLMALSCTGERAGDLVSQDFAFADQQLRYALTETENVRIFNPITVIQEFTRKNSRI